MKPLPKRVWILGWISLFADVASEMVYPIIPIFLNKVVMAPAMALGGIEGFAEAIVSFMKGWSGWQSDRTGKRVPYIQVGYGLSALGKPIIGFATSMGLVLFGRALDRFGKGIRTTSRDALIADSVEKSDYGRAFGLHRTMDTTGAFLGGVVLLVLLATLVHRLGDLRTIFLIALVPGLISVALTFLIKDVPKTEESTNTKTAQATLKSMPSGYWRAVVITLLFGLANSSDTFLILRANDLFSANQPGFVSWFGNTTTFGNAVILTTLTYLLFNVTYVFSSYPAGLISDRIGRWPVLAVGIALYAGVYAGFAYAEAGLLWVLFAFYGIYKGLTDGVGKALVADHAPKDAKGTALGFFYMGAGFMTLIGNLVSGWLWDAYSPAAAFIFGAATALLALILIPLTKRMER